VLTRWTWGKPAKLVAETLEAARVGPEDGPVAVVGAPGLAKLLREQGRNVLAVAPTDRSLKPFRGGALRAQREALPVLDGALTALVALDDATDPAVVEWSRSVRDAGIVILLGDEAEASSRRALCAGLVDIEQRSSGRFVLTSGRVKKI
jgi:hypothetical protein